MKKGGFQLAMEVLDLVRYKKEENDYFNRNFKIAEIKSSSKSDHPPNEEKTKRTDESTHTINSNNNINSKSQNAPSKLRLLELKNEERQINKDNENREYLNENFKSQKSQSPDSKIDTNSNSSSQGIKFSSKIQFSLNKNINIIPIIKKDIPLPRKDNFKEKLFLTPREMNKEILTLKGNYPSSAKNCTSNGITFETNKFTNKIYTNMKNELTHKSPSPNHNENTLINITSKSNNSVNRANKIS
jgi:hypothetical protein